MCWYFPKSKKKAEQRCTYIIILFICISIFQYCNHVWGNTYPSNLERMVLMQKRLVRVITCSHYRAHTEPLMLANRLLSLQDINLYIIGIFMYNYVTQKLPHIFENYFQQNKDVHELNTRQANDFHVPFSRHASRHVRHARSMMHVRIAKARWRGKCFRHSLRMGNP